MTANYVLLERITVGLAGASSISFNNIPQTGYTDLKVVVSARDTRSGSVLNGLVIRFNGLSTGFSSRVLEGSGSGASSFTDTQGLIGENTSASATANTFSSTDIYIPNYTSSNYKSFSFDSVTENNATAAYADLGAGLWSNTAAITSVTLTSLNSASFVQYSTFSLYALAAVGTTPTKAPKAIGGDIIQTDGTYWYHAFLSSGSFTPQTALSCDVLVVAGGGGGGTNKGGGGGAGGVAYLTPALMTATSYNAVVGAGGSYGSPGAVGTNSTFFGITANGGGGGGGESSRNAVAGGSSGGASRTGSTAAATQGTSGGATGYGNAGGAGAEGPTAYGGGGGGGAGGAGAAMNGSAGVGGAGGAGLNTWSSWLSATGLGVSGYIAGGGGGAQYLGSGAGAGGAGGGGAGGAYPGNAGANGVANTGSGGGGGSDTQNGGNGGSGLVIVRYAY